MNKYLPIITIFLILSVGTVAYHYLENWSYIDSLYFSTTTLSTIGFGDIHPTTDVSKLFTVIYVIGGVGTMLFELTQMRRPEIEQQLSKGIGAIKKKMDGGKDNGDDGQGKR